MDTLIGKALSTIAIAVCCVTSASANTYTADFSDRGELETPGQFAWEMETIRGAATLSFHLIGYDSLDGAGPYGNWYRDIFHLSVNGVEVFSGSFNMGGIGDDAIYQQPSGSKVTTINRGFFEGGFSDLTIPLGYLTEGLQVLEFAYTGNLQEPGDEAWGVGRARLSVPEPSVLSLAILGLGLLVPGIGRLR